MKKLLFSLSLLASLATFAGESSVEATAQVYGVMPITSCASNVIVCVPWRAASSSADADIAVEDLIRTAELNEGDWIRAWDKVNARFNVWNLQEVSGVKTWVKGTVVTAAGASTANDSSDTTLARGDAVILHRTQPGTSSAPATFYVQGQYKALSGESTVVTAGTSDTPAYTLLAPPVVSGTVSLNSKMSGTRVYGDHIICGKTDAPNTPKYYQYNTTRNSFGYKNKGEWVEPVLSAGVGCWYVSVGGSPTFTW